jgi:hypothetical protein
MDSDKTTKQSLEEISKQIENLAIATKNGFDDIKRTMATKDDLETLKENLEEKYSNRFDVFNDQLRIVKNKIGIS